MTVSKIHANGFVSIQLPLKLKGGTNSTKAIYFPMALELAPLTWLESLKRDTIHSWEDLKTLFVDNF